MTEEAKSLYIAFLIAGDIKLGISVVSETQDKEATVLRVSHLLPVFCLFVFNKKMKPKMYDLHYLL